MGGKSFIIVGATGMGKTTFTKNALKKLHKDSILLYDVNNEYKDIYPKPFIKFEKFCELSERVSNAVIVFEEATIFLDSRGNNFSLKDVLVRKRHTNNTIFLVFHSLRLVPRYIFDLSNYVVLHKTNDSESLVSSKFENELLTKAFLEVKNAPMKVAENGKKYSPCKIFSIY